MLPWQNQHKVYCSPFTPTKIEMWALGKKKNKETESSGLKLQNLKIHQKKYLKSNLVLDWN